MNRKLVRRFAVAAMIAAAGSYALACTAEATRTVIDSSAISLAIP